MSEEKKTTRLESIDALRGYDMFFIAGGAGILTAIAAFLPDAMGAAVKAHTTHANWGAWYFYDYIFPTFLFLAGVSWPFSLASQRAKGRTDGEIHRKILWRMVALILLGWLHDDILKFNWEHQRLASVIGRIGIAWAVAAFLYMHVTIRKQLAICAALLVGYWAIIRFIPNPDAVIPAGATPLTNRAYCITGWVDRNFLTIAKPGYDGGAFATIGMPVTAMFGALAGTFLKRQDMKEGRKTLLMLAGAVGMAILGVLWLPWCPNIKSIWTPTYALIAGSIALGLLAVFHWLIDVKGWRKWAYFGTIIGMNSITIYMMQHFVSFKRMSELFFGGTASLCSPEVGTLILAVGRVALAWTVLWFFARKRIFLRV